MDSFQEPEVYSSIRSPAIADSSTVHELGVNPASVQLVEIVAAGCCEVDPAGLVESAGASVHIGNGSTVEAAF